MSVQLIDANIIKKTQDSLGKIIKKPPMTEKLLSKPPFRFLHDIATSVIKSTGFMKGLFTETELNSDNVKEKDAKIAFLQKVIDIVSLVLGRTMSAKPSRIISGSEPEKTNELLQMLAEAINKKVDNDEYVQRVLKSDDDGDVRAKKDSSKHRQRDKDDAEKSSKKEDRSSNKKEDEKKHRSSKNHEEKLSVADEEKASKDKKRDKSRHDREGERDKDRKEEDKQEHHKDRKKDKNESRDEKDRSREKKEDEESRNDRRDKHRSKDRSHDERKHRRGGDDSNHDDAEQRKKDRSERRKHHEEGGKDDQSSPAKSRSKASHESEGKTRSDQMNAIQRPTSAKGTRQRKIKAEETKTGEPSRMNSASANKPKLARPSSARPPPPKPKSKETQNEGGAPAHNSWSNSKVIIDEKQDSDDEDFILKEDDSTWTQQNGGRHVAGDGDDDDAHPGEHGMLVKKILDTKKNLETNANLSKKTEIDNSESGMDAGKLKDRELMAKEIEKIRASIQTTTRSINPLGKTLDLLQENMDSMLKELEMWKEETKQNRKLIQVEESKTESALEPLKTELSELDISIAEQLDLIAAVKSNIITNDKKLSAILNSVMKS